LADARRPAVLHPKCKAGDLSNAIKFTPEAGSVAVRASAVGSELFRIDVEDTGIGIPPEHLGKLFVEFQQLDASTAKKYQGTGLGLALTKRIIEAQGGWVEVQSAVGKGSTFSAILPRTATRISEPPLELQGGPLQNASILVVDDDLSTLKLVEAALGSQRVRVICKLTAQAALLSAEADPPGIVVLDLVMPGMDGFQFLSRFRELPGCAQVPIVIWTVKDITHAERASLGRSTTAVVRKGGRGVEALVDELQPFLGSLTQ